MENRIFEVGKQHEVIRGGDDDDDDSFSLYSAPHIMLVIARHVACIGKVRNKCTHSFRQET
jgi:hypothetical protein